MVLSRAGRKTAPGLKNAVRNIVIRRAVTSEQEELEALSLRASLANAGDRDALLAHPDAIELPLSQIAAGGVFAAEWKGKIVAFAAVEPRADGDSELELVRGSEHATSGGRPIVGRILR